jgi:hypothetical protein
LIAVVKPRGAPSLALPLDDEAKVKFLSAFCNGLGLGYNHKALPYPISSPFRVSFSPAKPFFFDLEQQAGTSIPCGTFVTGEVRRLPSHLRVKGDVVSTQTLTYPEPKISKLLFASKYSVPFSLVS